MSYWNFSPGGLESMVFRRSATGAGFENIPANFNFDAAGHSASQNQIATSTSNSSNDQRIAQQHNRPTQQQQQNQTGSSGIVTTQAPIYHQQQFQSQQRQQQPPSITPQQQQMKPDSRDQSQNAAAASAVLNLQISHMQPIGGDGFLPVFSTTNPETNVGNPVVASVTGMLLSSIPAAVTVPNNAVVPTAAIPAASTKAKKSKKKKPTVSASSVPPSMTVQQRAPAPRAQCSRCERNYGNRRDLRRHVLAHHEGIRYMCRLCSKIMMSAKSVRAHLKSSAHRLSDDNEIALNIEKVTPTVPMSMVLAPFDAANAGSSGGSGSATTNTNKKKT